MSNVLKKTLLVLGVIILISAVALPLISKVKATNEDLDLNSLIDDGDDNNTANNNTENSSNNTTDGNTENTKNRCYRRYYSNRFYCCMCWFCCICI